MIRKYLGAVCAISMFAASASATEHNNPSDITISCNQHGAVVKTANGATYYLGNNCDASQPGVGDGRWWFAASAFIIEINGTSVRFARDLTCNVPFCRP